MDDETRAQEGPAEGSGKWRQAGVPHKGWVCIGIQDLGDDRMVCGMCEAREIRYAHLMEHKRYPGTLYCGRICAGHMEEDLEAAAAREKRVRNAVAQRRGWLKRAWGLSSKGNPMLLTRDDFRVTVFKRGAYWRASVEDLEAAGKLFPRSNFDTEDAAKLGAFDAMAKLKARRSG